MEFLKKVWIYLLAILVAIVLIIGDYTSRKNVNNEEFDIEEYAKTLVEESQIRVNDKIYNGTYTSEEITTLPEGYELLGEIKECITEGALTENLTSNSVGAGYRVYVNKNDDSKILLRVTDDSEEYQSYIEYVLKK